MYIYKQIKQKYFCFEFPNVVHFGWLGSKHQLTNKLLRSGAPLGEAILVRSLPMKSRQGLARDVLDTSAAHAELVPDVTDTD